MGVYGLGGVGKTQLVLKYIHDYGFQYSNVFWIVAADELKLSTSYKDIAFKLGLRFTEDVPNSSREAFRTWLDTHDDWLLVFDNADKTNILASYWPSSIRGHLLTTSRSAELVESRRVDKGVELQLLKIEDGTEFLLRGLAGSALLEDECFDGDGAARISKRLGGHPLALSHAASFIDAMGCTFDEYLGFLETQQETLVLKHEAGGATFDYELSYATCFKMSTDQLKKVPAGRLLAMLSVLDPDDIPVELFKGYASAKDCIRVVSPLRNLATYLNAMANLKKHTLIQRDQQKGGASVSIHRIVQDAGIREFWHDDQAQSLFEDIVACLERVYPKQVNGESMSQDFPRCKIWTPHVIALLNNLDRVNYSREDAGGQPPIVTGQIVAELLANAGWYLYEVGQKDTAMEVLNVGRKICERLFGDDPHKLTALIYNNIGVIHNSWAETEQSLECAMKTLSIREQCLGPADPETGNSYTNYACSLHDLERLKDAQHYFEQAVKVHENSPIKSADLLEGAYSNLGRNLIALGRFDDAEVAFQKAYEFHADLKPGNFFTALTLFLWGNLRIRQQQWTEAEKLHSKAFILRQELLGQDHNLTGVSHHTMAHLRQHGGDVQAAIQHLRDAIAVFEKQEHGEPGLLPRSCFKLADILMSEARDICDMSLLTESRELKDRAIALCEKDTSLMSKPFKSENDWNMMVQYEYRY